MLTATTAPSAYRFNFAEGTDLAEVRETLALALLAAESIHGAAQVNLDGNCQVCDERCAVLIDIGTEVGVDVARLFVGFAVKQFVGMKVERVTRTPAAVGGVN